MFHMLEKSPKKTGLRLALRGRYQHDERHLPCYSALRKTTGPQANGQGSRAS